MIELPLKFKKALGNGVRTSLFPIIRFYKNVRLDERDTWDQADSVNLSIKETNLSGINFDGLLLNAPNIQSKADLENNKYTISNVSLSISNVNYKGKVFSDDIQNLLNAVCEIYYCANGIDKIEDCLLVYTGTVRRYNQSQETLSLTLEDITEQMLKTKIPSTLVPNEPFYRKDDKGKPFPMVYGYVDKSPLITRFSGLNEMGQLQNKIGEFHIDKPSKLISGMWDSQTENWGYELNEGHRLYTEGYLKNTEAFLSVYKENFSPIFRELSDDWGFGGYDLPVNDKIYNFRQSNGNDTSASVIVNSDALIALKDIYGLPTRFYRPIESIECFTYCDNVQGGDNESINRIYGFTNFVSGESGGFEPYQKDHIFNTDAYDNNWSSEDQTWWQPTASNENINGGVYSSVDTKWIQSGRDGFFPTTRIQNGTINDGLYICGRNIDGERVAHNKSGGAYIRLKLKENVGDYDCVTKLIYDAEYHSLSGMNNSGNQKNAYPAQFWTNNFLVELDKDIQDNNYLRASDMQELNAPYLPNSDFEQVQYDNQTSTEESVSAFNAEAISESFNKTTSFNSIQFGIPQYPKKNTTAGNDEGFVAAQLYNAWVLQDSVITDPLNETFYLDVAGRVAQSDYQNVISDLISVYRIEVVEDDLGEKTFILSLGTNESDNASSAEYLQNFIDNNLVDLHLSIQQASIWDGIYFNWEYPYNDGTGIYKIKLFELPFGNVVEYGDYGPIQLQFRMVEPFALNPYTKADNIMLDILNQELNYQGEAELSNTTDNWQYAFTLNEQEEAKQVFEKMFESSTIIPSFNELGQFKFLENKQIIESYDDVVILNNQDIITYSYELTKIDNIYNQVNVKYKKNYASGEYDKETGYSLIDNDSNTYENLDTLSEFMYVGQPENQYTVEYFGLKANECKLEVETDFIRDDITARKLQKKLVCWYANQHLITKLQLPINYINLEVGDYIKFDQLIGDKLAFGYDYTKPQQRNGQYIYDVFFITKVSKSLDKVTIEAIQIHRGDYGFPDQDIFVDENIVDGAGNDGQGNFDLGDPTDNPNYNQDNVSDEFVDESELATFQFSWENENNLLNPITANVVTNLDQDWDYDIFVINVYTESGNPITFPEESNIQPLYNGIYSEENAPSAMNIVNHIKSISNMANNYNGKVDLSKKYDFQLDSEDDVIEVTYMIKVYNDSNVQYLTFTQDGIYTDLSSDINQDGIVNILDIVLLVQMILGEQEVSDNADITGDGIVNVLDVVTLVGEILGN